jgi:hypothetical protein
MRRMLGSRPSPALIIAMLALFVALAGTAPGLPGKRTVDHNDLRKHVVHTGKIHNGAVTRAKIANRAVNDAKLDSDSRARWAVATNGGDLVRSKGVVASEQISAGVYELTFNRDVSDCAWSATVARNVAAEPVPGEIGVRPPADNPRGVVVHIWNSAGAPASNRFHLVVSC